ncbi:hypothetical protein TRICI_006462 [Trichomonascus ciferrii]|uniref:Spindle pole body component n=1 Tax=Trichomonascus ciferrii TaxID=44093 RepID=A0A642UH66_9ASCO|nr:hypothetical protein TRICI_006462 [Trichomonascus ciferrii]
MDLAEAMEDQLDNLRRLCERDYHTVQAIDFLLQIPADPLAKKVFVREQEPVKPKELTWEDIIAEEPLEGEHWNEEVFDEDDESDESVEYEERGFVGQVYELPPEGEPYGLENYALKIEELWLDTPPKDGSFMSEADSVRECLYAVMGYPTELFAFRSDATQIPTPPHEHKRSVAHMSQEAFSDILHTVASIATTVRRLEIFTDADSAVAHFPTFEYEFAFGVVLGIYNRLFEDLLNLEKHVKSSSIVSLITVVQQLQKLVCPYQPLVHALTHSTNQVQLLNNLYESVCISESSNKTAPGTILLSAFVPVLNDYFTNLNNTQFMLTPYPDILTPHTDSLRQIAHITHHLNSLKCSVDVRLEPRFGFLGACPQTPEVGLAEDCVEKGLPRSGTTLFASFSGKRRPLTDDSLVGNGIHDIENAVHRAISEFEVCVSNRLKTYLDSCGLEEKIQQHVDIYFMFDKSGGMAQFLDNLIHADGPLERHSVSDQLYEAFPDKTVSIFKVGNGDVYLKIPIIPELQTIITPENVDTYNAIWNKLLLCKSTSAKQTSLPIITTLNSIMIQYVLILQKQAVNFFSNLHNNTTNILTLHNDFVQNALNSISNPAVDSFIQAPTPITPSNVLNWLNKPI